MMAGVSNAQRKSIYARDGFRCALCDGVDGMQIHHIKPRGKGGQDIDENLICLCRFCHALAHGTKLRDYCDMDTVGIEDMMAEYMADLYIDKGFIWNPDGNGLYDNDAFDDFIEEELLLHPDAKITYHECGAVGIEIPDDRFPF